jgi:uncharacterized membrane protein
MPTAFLAGHFARPEATALYGMSMVSCAAAFTVMRKYAEENGLLMENISKKVMKKVARMNILGVSLYVVSVFAGYLSVYVSYAIFALIPAMYFLPQRIEFEHE